MPSDDEALLEWATATYSKVWTFSSIGSANVINLQVGQDPNAPEECRLTRNYQQSHITASQVEPVRIGYCSPDISRATQEVHIIWLLSPSSSVVVELNEVSRNAASKRRIVLVLQADTPLVWNVVSDANIRHLTIVSDHQVNTEGITSAPFEVQKENIPTKVENLYSWALDRYSAVVSYTEAVLANKFDITVGKANISKHTHLLSPDHAGSTSIDWPNDSPHVVVECLKNSIRALVPMQVAQYYNLSPEDITLEDRQCTSMEYMTLGFMLDTQLNACGTTSEQRLNKMVYRNRVLFFNGSPEGSGAGIEGSGGNPLNDVDVDDEDSTLPFYASSIECEFLHGPTNTNSDMTNNHVTLHMDMYETPLFQNKVVDFPAPLQDHSRLYFQVGVSGGQRRHEVVINQCWIQAANEIVHSLIDFSCPVDQTIIFHELNPNYVSLDPQEDGDLKRFSFQVHWTRETFGLHTFVSCKLSLCSKDFNTVDEEKGIPVCSTLEALQQACSGNPGVRVGQQLTTGPSKTLEIGPLLDSSIEISVVDSNDIDNEVNVGNTACLEGNSAETISGLGAGPAAAIAFAAFTIGVLLTACLWFIHAHTGPRREIPGSPRTLSSPSSPLMNGHIPNGHLPNGGPMVARQRPPPAPAPNGPLHIPLANGMNPNMIPARGLMNGPIGESV
ncbi:transforming growth factor beta receptor type 3-like [Lytechinus pictus]|uniref:transforming growth factor beta receptor type 3-like n=1 Tax=Lytechinus pictus TaxID=7653 RepID=UPI0030B9C32D